eukprot:scaffold34594_cov165-Amphora_coffeaeformis.AAC.7
MTSGTTHELASRPHGLTNSHGAPVVVTRTHAPKKRCEPSSSKGPNSCQLDPSRFDTIPGMLNQCVCGMVMPTVLVRAYPTVLGVLY